MSTLSVVLPNYNHSGFLEESLTAILSQSYAPQEVIVVDDASTDDSIAVIERIAARDARVRLVRNATNRGAIFSLNEGLNIVSGDYVYLASADDVALPGLFERCMHLLSRHPQAGLCCADPVYLDVTTGNRRRHHVGLSAAGYLDPASFTARARRHGAHLAGVATIVKRSALEEAGGLLERLQWKCDWFLLLVVAFRHGLCYVPEPLGLARLDPRAYGSAASQSPRAQRDVIRQLFACLRSPRFRDVRPRFLESGVLASLPRAGSALLGSPRYWNELSMRIARDSLWPAVMMTAARSSPSWLKRVYRQLRHAEAGRLGCE